MKERHSSVQLSRRLVLSGASAFTLSGCFGSFGATRELWKWNEGVGNKWVNWLVFLGLSIIPVYALFVIADALVLNSVEFWTGSNPVRNASDGRSTKRVATADRDTLRLEISRHGQLEGVVYCRRLEDGGLQLLDESGRQLSRVSALADGGLELRGSEQVLLTKLDAEAYRRVYAGVELGRPVQALLTLELGQRGLQLAHSGAASSAL
jgi:hypothetical protein